MPAKDTWRELEIRDDLAIAFFGEGVATAAADLLPRLSPPPGGLSWLRQIHSSHVLQASPGLAGGGDALISDESGLALAVATADCVPVLLAGRRRIAAVHAGWRGLVAGVVPAALALFDSPADIEAWIGPAIGSCCYEIGDDVAQRLRDVSDDTVLSDGPSGRVHADLVAVARHQLQPVRRIHQLDLCTRCQVDSLASYRRDGTEAGRNWSVIWRPR